MISVVLYGRNDSYGYNLHKRAAISLNSIAHVLCDDDEIVFVDYNSQPGFPSFLHAIHDTLTEKAKALSRAIVVPHAFHQKYYGDKTHLKALEPIARNIGIRRTNPKNDWILSTNTDIVMLLRGASNLQNLLTKISSAEVYCCAPRFEIPEGVWENFARDRPHETMRSLELLNKDLHLEQVVFGSQWNVYDAPGDFQLIRRKALFELRGFDEQMFKGWHCDSNLNKRLFLKYGPSLSLYPSVKAFHCDHTRELTPMHTSGSVKNDEVRFIDHVTDFIANSDSWGASCKNFREYKGSDFDGHVEIEEAKLALSTYRFRPNSIYYNNSFYAKTPFSVPTTLTFLFDSLVMRERDINIGWFGYDEAAQQKTFKYLERQGFVNLNVLDVNTNWRHMDVIIVNLEDITFPMKKRERLIQKVDEELDFLASQRPNLKHDDLPTYFFLNANHSQFEDYIRRNFVVATTPLLIKLLSGKPTVDLLKRRSVSSINLTVAYELDVFQGATFDEQQNKIQLIDEPWTYSFRINFTKIEAAGVQPITDLSSTTVSLFYESAYKNPICAFLVTRNGEQYQNEVELSNDKTSVKIEIKDRPENILGIMIRNSREPLKDGFIKIKNVQIDVKPNQDGYEIRPVDFTVTPMHGGAYDNEIIKLSDIPSENSANISLSEKDLTSLFEKNKTVSFSLVFEIEKLDPGELVVFPFSKAQKPLLPELSVSNAGRQFFNFYIEDLTLVNYLIIRQSSGDKPAGKLRILSVYAIANIKPISIHGKDEYAPQEMNTNFENLIKLFNVLRVIDILRMLLVSRRERFPRLYFFLKIIYRFWSKIKKDGTKS